MTIRTRFDVEDKVWVYIEEDNAYFNTKVISFDVSYRGGGIETTYYLDNPFYKETRFEYCGYSREWKNENILRFPDDLVFATASELFDWLESQSDKKIIEAKELKKGLFR